MSPSTWRRDQLDTGVFRKMTSQDEHTQLPTTAEEVTRPLATAEGEEGRPLPQQIALASRKLQEFYFIRKGRQDPSAPRT